MKFSEIGRRINGIGISTPIFGFSVGWVPSESEKNIAREVIIFLEDRRVLYKPYQMEYQDECVQSVLAMRRFLTDKISASSSDELERNLRAMRGACRNFLDRASIPPNAGDRYRYGYDEGQNVLVFNDALGELRSTFGLHIGILAAKYGIDIEDDLEKILPADESE